MKSLTGSRKEKTAARLQDPYDFCEEGRARWHVVDTALGVILQIGVEMPR